MVRRVIELPLVYKSYIWYSPDQKRISSHYHRQIVNALSTGDAERAELIMKEHVFEARDLLVARVRAEPTAVPEPRVSEAVGARSRSRPDVDGPGPLAGVRVLELGMLLAGPFTGRLLGDMGAEIIKVEPPGQPDPLRDWGHARYEGRSLWWPVQSRNKKCVTLNLREERGQELLLGLAEQSDVLVENFRPGTLERWNLGPEQLWAVNPGLVIARVSGYGQTGPYAPRAGFASVSEAMGGIRYINGFPDEPPPRIHISLGDSLAGMFAVQGILAALYRRDALGGGRGQVVDVSLMEACFALLESMVPEYDRLGIVRGPGGTGLKGVAPSNIFRSSDGTWIVIAANADKVFGRLCEAMGQPELAEHEKFATHLARGSNQEELEGIVAEWAGRHTRPRSTRSSTRRA